MSSKRFGLSLLAFLACSGGGAGCQRRAVSTQDPTTKVNFTNTQSQQAIDKVDLLFAIDNSRSMGDKQKILANAVPDLIKGLLRPRCVDIDNRPDPAKTRAVPTGNTRDRFGCPEGYDPEFKPVTDMHIGVISSSLGTLGGDVCDEKKEPRNNDRGRLIGKPLAWFPETEENKDPKRHPVPADPVKTIDELETRFRELVVGVDQTGCGLEAQLESVYRFLIQPDPWETVESDGKRASLKGVDTTLLAQRAEFLRADSLVAVIMLTDEDDSTADPLAFNGQGWAFMNTRFPNSPVDRPGTGGGSTAPHGTAACESDPGNSECTSCAFSQAKSDPSCAGNAGYYGPEDDDINVRFQHMKQRYGVDPQYPIQRYIDGFTKSKVPDRDAEHVQNGDSIEPYTGAGNCRNPLFAQNLPRTAQNTKELCDLEPGPRTPDRIFFAVIGGVPNRLLHFVPDDADKSAIKPKDWELILGKDPAHFDYANIDGHMVQSIDPRTKWGLGDAEAPRGDNGKDPDNGREWQTDKSDLQYACTFDLLEDMQRDCTADDQSCDCGSQANGTNPPLCNSGNRQIKAKAYPTIREFQVVRGLGDQGIIGSLCPIQLDNPGPENDPEPTYGYRPAISAIVERLKNVLSSQCLPQRLQRSEGGEDSGKVPCLVLAQLSDKADTCAKYADRGLEEVTDETVLRVFREQQLAAGIDLPVCQVSQAVAQPGDTCKDNADMVWCYVEKVGEKAPAGPNCAQGLILSRGTQDLPQAKFSLQCINQR